MHNIPRRLAIVSHVVHYRHDGRLFAYAPYAREIDIWADLFQEVVIAAPCHEGQPPGDCAPFTRPNIYIAAQRETGGNSIGAKVAQLAALPVLALDLSRVMRRADAIHVRCPGNLGLLGALLAPMFSSRVVAKYAGQWTEYPGEARTVRLQRALLGSRWFRGPVTVYGKWPNQPPHVISFFTSVLTEEQVRRAGRAAAARRWEGPLRVLFVGRLSQDKNVHVLLSALATLRAGGLAFECVIVGDGPMRGALEAQAAAAGIGDSVRFAGGVAFEQVLDYYEWAHVLVLASETEGWPKAIAEGMTFGLVCIGSERGLVPQMLGDGRGIVVTPGDVDALAGALGCIARSPGDSEEMGRRAAAWARDYTLEGLREALRALLSERWGVPIGDPAVAATRSGGGAR